jgi:hypothetical protein
MQLYNYLKPKMQFIGTLVMAFAMFSCGSYQYAGYEDDSIYGDTERTVRTVEYVEEAPATDNSTYYKNYFKDKSEQYAAISDENDVIFTDIDSYESTYAENDTLYYDSYGGWGENNTDVSINIYGGHAFNSIWWNRPYYTSWGWNYGYGYGNVWGYGFNSWGWNRPLWLDFGYGLGWGYNNWWCPPFYNNWGWNRPYWNGGYYGGYYSNRALAYNSTRRGAAYANGSMANMSRRSSINSPITSRRTMSSDLNRRGTINRSSTTNRRRINTNPSSRTRIGSTNSSRIRTTNSTRSRPKTTTRSNISRSRPSNISRGSSSRINNSGSRNISRSNSGSSSRSSATRSSSSSRSSGSSRSSSSRSSTSRRGNN